jgi:hypothetical protein
MSTPTVTERAAALEPVTRDDFADPATFAAVEPERRTGMGAGDAARPAPALGTAR